MAKTIAVFGSSRTPPNTPEYAAAVEIGAKLAQAGYAVMTGGYAGIMEAASKGAYEAGGHVIGVTSAQIEAIRPIPANQWVMEDISIPKMEDRLIHLIKQADGYVVMPGGVGTLNELVMAWELMRVNEIPVRPLVCYGEIWERTLAAFLDDRYIPPHHKHMVMLAGSPEQVIELIHGKVTT